MSQGDVYEFLKKNDGKWFNTKAIGEGIDSAPGHVVTKLTRMMNFFPELEKMKKFEHGYARNLYRYDSRKKKKGVRKKWIG